MVGLVPSGVLGRTSLLVGDLGTFEHQPWVWPLFVTWGLHLKQSLGGLGFCLSHLLRIGAFSMLVIGVCCPGNRVFSRLWICFWLIALSRASGWWGPLGAGAGGPSSRVPLLGAGSFVIPLTVLLIVMCGVFPLQ